MAPLFSVLLLGHRLLHVALLPPSCCTMPPPPSRILLDYTSWHPIGVFPISFFSSPPHLSAAPPPSSCYLTASFLSPSHLAFSLPRAPPLPSSHLRTSIGNGRKKKKKLWLVASAKKPESQCRVCSSLGRRPKDRAGSVRTWV